MQRTLQQAHVLAYRTMRLQESLSWMHMEYEKELFNQQGNCNKLQWQAANSREKKFLGFRSHHSFLAPGQVLLLEIDTLPFRVIFHMNCLSILLSKISWKVFQILPLLIILHHLTLSWPNVKNEDNLSHCTCKKQQGTVLNH